MGANHTFGNIDANVGALSPQGELMGKVSKNGDTLLRQGSKASAGDVVNYRHHVAISLGNGINVGATQRSAMGGSDNGLTIKAEGNEPRKYYKPIDANR